MINDSLINSWVNPLCRLLNEEYTPHLTYSEPPSDGYWDIPISPNATYFAVFESFDCSLPDHKRLPMEFERLNRFYAKHGSSVENIWPNDRPSQSRTIRCGSS